MHFSFQVCFDAFLPKKTSLFPQSTWQPVTVGRQSSAAPHAAICGRDKCKHRDSHQTETICTVTGKTKSKNKGQETQEQNPCLFPGGGIVLGGRTDHGTACPGRICRRSIAEAGTGCRCARCWAEVRSETPGMCVTSRGQHFHAGTVTREGFLKRKKVPFPNRAQAPGAGLISYPSAAKKTATSKTRARKMLLALGANVRLSQTAQPPWMTPPAVNGGIWK